jgi:hypothetical protein
MTLNQTLRASLVCATALAFGQAAEADQLIYYDFNTYYDPFPIVHPGTAAVTYADPAFSTVTDFTLRDTSAGETQTVSGGVTFGNGWSDADGNAFAFNFTVASGKQVTFTDASFFDERQNKDYPPQSWALTLGGSAFGSGNITNVGFYNEVFDPSDLVFGAGTYTAMLAAIGTGSSGAAADFSRQWSIDKFNLNGTVENVAAVPLPAAAWMLLSGLAGLGAMAKQRRAA